MTSSVIYHVTTASQWMEAKKNGFYEHPSLQSEGFIHCSQAHQVAGVLERYFAGQDDLVKLVIEADRLSSPLQLDWSPAIHDDFPHIYGPLNIDAVTEVIAI